MMTKKPKKAKRRNRWRSRLLRNLLPVTTNKLLKNPSPPNKTRRAHLRFTSENPGSFLMINNS
jgi:hypothetical protein